MSDTPRTDAHNWHDGDYDDPLDAFADFAKQLERELTAANERIKRLEEFTSRFLNPNDLGWAIGKYDRDEAREAVGKERVESKAKEAKL